MADNKAESKKEDFEIESLLKIFDLEHNIDRIALETGENLPKELISLREKAFFAHSYIERKIEIIIALKLLNDTSEKIDLNSKIADSTTFYTDIKYIFGEMSFYAKLDIANNIKSIPKTLYEKVKKLNKIRNSLSHLQDQEYKKYLNLSERITALNDINDALNSIREHWGKPIDFTKE